MSRAPQDWVRAEIQALEAYSIPPARGLIKLDAMENPYGWPLELVEAWLERLKGAALNRYPDPQAQAVKNALGRAMALPADSQLLLGNGSDELIQLICLALAGPGRVVMAPQPSFVMYRMIATFTGMDYVGVPLQAEDFALDMPAMVAALERHRPAVVFLAHPNNPTGNLFDQDALRTVIEAAPGLVVVDEAYTSFAEHSCRDWLGDYNHLLLMRTVSKLGLAGLRLGLLAGPKAWLGELDKLRLPYNINVLTQISAAFALEHYNVLLEQAAAICQERARLYEALRKLPGVTPFPSQANFILLRCDSQGADKVFRGLLEAGVLVKNLSPGGGILADCLRVTVGRPEENDAFLQALSRNL